MAKICIDSGHGSNTPGKRTPPFKKLFKSGSEAIKKGEQYREHYANTGIANLLYIELKNRGYEVIRTGWNGKDSRNDPDVPLSDRQKKIRDSKCDISVSIHFNAIGDGKSFNSADGIGVYIHDKFANDSKRLAVCVFNELTKGTKQKARGINAESFAMVNCKTMKTKASILVECAFMTNEREAELMANSKYWLETAVEIANGIDKYFK
jgi:N-acetylmuramoyl-L-alanine amidase